MAQTVYSLRLYAAQNLAPGSGVVGPVVPAGFIYVLRDIDVCSFTSTTGDELLVKGPTGGNVYVVVLTAGGDRFNFQWRGRQVYAEGEQIGFHSLAGGWDVMASGYQLTLP